MKMMTLLVSGAIGFALTGCETHEWSTLVQSGPDGALCGTPGALSAVYIEIHYAGDGTPSAVPDKCTVSPNADITWRGPGGDLIPFEIVFPGESPALRDDRPRLPASEDGGRYKVKIKASAKVGTYKYGISANGKEIDPAIIIK
jgi:hypothetical protein